MQESPSPAFTPSPSNGGPAPYEFKFKDYSPYIFRNLRERFVGFFFFFCTCIGLKIWL
jgi:hypothetical protein